MGPSLALWAPALERLFNSSLLTGSFTLQQELVYSMSSLFSEDASVPASLFAPGFILTCGCGSSPVHHYSACHGDDIGALLHIRSEVSPGFIPPHQTKPSPCP